MGVAATPVARVGEFFPILYTSPVVAATTSNKNFQKIRYRAPYIRFQTDGQTDRLKDITHEHSEIINIDIDRFIYALIIYACIYRCIQGVSKRMS